MDISIFFLALGSGLISFISPCNAALIPTFVSYITAQGKDAKHNVLMSVVFAIGYALMFTLISLILNSLDNLIKGIRYINLISGIVIIGMSLYLLFSKNLMSSSLRKVRRVREQDPHSDNIAEKGVNKDHDHRIEGAHDQKSQTSRAVPSKQDSDTSSTQFKWNGNLGAFLLGVSLGSAFIPCVTPMYASILTISFQYSLITQYLMQFFFAVGLTLPFILLGLFIGKITSYNRLVVKLVKYGSVLQRIFAIFLIWIGVEIILTGYGYAGILPII